MHTLEYNVGIIITAFLTTGSSEIVFAQEIPNVFQYTITLTKERPILFTLVHLCGYVWVVWIN